MRISPLVLALPVAALTACGSQPPASTLGSSPAGASAVGPMRAGASTAATAAAGGTACTDPGTLPPNALTKPVADVDGDGRADTGFIAGTGTGPTTIGIRTAAGGVFRTTFTSTNSTTSHRGVLFADVSGTGRGPFVALTDDNRYSRLFVVQSCSLVPAISGEGTQYVFDLGYGGAGDGVACSTLEEATRRSLVGFAYVNADELRTAVEIDTSRSPVTATNGGQDRTTTQHPARVSCGNVTTEGLELGG